jgi:kynurenine formamidase
LPVEAIHAWESRHSAIVKDEIVIFNFGCHRKWKLGADGRKFVATWPGLSRDAAAYLPRPRCRS